MSNLTDRRTAMLVLLILFLDLVGFTLIFPLVPEMLDFYLTGARTPGSIDAWLLPLSQAARDLLPADRQDDTTMIILLGGILASLYSVLQFATSPYWGKLSDRIGRRPVLLITSLGLAVSYALWFLSSSFTLFIISRVVGGLMSGNMSVASAAMADTTTPEGRTRAMGMVGAAFGLGFVIGPVIGGLTSLVDLSAGQAHSLLHPFSLAALTAFALALLSAGCNILWLRETLTAERRHQHQWTTNPLGTVRRNLRDPD
ncbi:MAG: MFS transporter, partial [Leptospiraceae bacterium]|nr:MFS transporter [Leptospiraceae bacterium]